MVWLHIDHKPGLTGLKVAYVLITFSSLRAQPVVVTFWCQMKALNYFSQLPIHYTLVVIAENLPIFSLTILILCIFITASSPDGATFFFFFFCSKKESKMQPCGEIVQNLSQGSAQSVTSETRRVKISTTGSNYLNTFKE